MSGAFFTADTHFGHRGVLSYSNRPFTTIEEHDSELVRRWNAVVGPHDDVFHLGDVSFVGKQRTEAILGALNGRIHLVLGNHDKPLRAPSRQDRFEWVKDYAEIKIGTVGQPQRIVLCHYPIESWNRRHHGAWHLHGHCHGSLPYAAHHRRIDVGVDCWSYAPVSFAELTRAMQVRGFKAVDHHVERLE
jgi:calcineurin-like phosphoesterase family protein